MNDTNTYFLMAVSLNPVWWAALSEDAKTVWFVILKEKGFTIYHKVLWQWVNAAHPEGCFTLCYYLVATVTLSRQPWQRWWSSRKRIHFSTCTLVSLLKAELSVGIRGYLMTGKTLKVFCITYYPLHMLPPAASLPPYLQRPPGLPHSSTIVSNLQDVHTGCQTPANILSASTEAEWVGKEASPPLM